MTLNNGDTQVTPFSITVPRNEDLQFHFSKPGYQSTDVADNSQVEAVYLMVDVIPLMIPWAIDAGLGAGYAHQQTAVIARLDPSHGSSAEAVSDGPAAASVDPRGAKH